MATSRLQARDALLEALADIRERQFRAFALAGRGDAVSDRAVGQQARQQNSFSSEKAHECSFFDVSVAARTGCPMPRGVVRGAIGQSTTLGSQAERCVILGRILSHRNASP